MPAVPYCTSVSGRGPLECRRAFESLGVPAPGADTCLRETHTGSVNCRNCGFLMNNFRNKLLLECYVSFKHTFQIHVRSDPMWDTNRRKMKLATERNIGLYGNLLHSLQKVICNQREEKYLCFVWILAVSRGNHCCTFKDLTKAKSDIPSGLWTPSFWSPLVN